MRHFKTNTPKALLGLSLCSDPAMITVSMSPAVRLGSLSRCIFASCKALSLKCDVLV